MAIVRTVFSPGYMKQKLLLLLLLLLSLSSSWLYSPLMDCDLQFLNPTVGRTPWTAKQSITRSLSTPRTTQTQNKHIQTSIPQVRFKPITPVFKWAKTVHASNRMDTVISTKMFSDILSTEH
jgi:hypothetical protein